MGNALKTSLVGFQPHGAEKSPLGALTLGSEPPQGGIFKGENGVHWRPKKILLLLKPWMRNTIY